MMKTNSLFLLLAIFLATSGLYGQNVRIGTGTSASNAVLIGTSTTTAANYSRSAAIYTAAEIINAGGRAGYINKLWWYKDGTGEFTAATATLKVYIKHTPATSHASTPVTWNTDTVGSTPVFSSTSYGIPTGTGWKQLTFSTPFVWNGTDNIEILVDWYRPTNPSASITWAYTAVTNTNAFSVSTTGAPGAPATMTRSNNRPNLQLEIIDSAATDVALLRIETPGESLNPGVDSVCVKLRNWGGQALNSVEIDWEIDGVMQPMYTHTFAQPLATTDSSGILKLGNYTFTPGYHTIRTWTKNPNNTADADRRNDTLTRTIWVKYPAFAGTYTINPSQPASLTNFTSFSEAVRAINEAGISSSVIFEVPANAVFNESNILLTATGTATDSIVFRKSGNGANPLIIAQTGVSTTRDFIMGVEGSDYIVFDGINLKDPATTTSTTDQMEWGYAFFVRNATDGSMHNTIRNCRIELPSTARSSGTSIGIYSVNQAAAAATTIVATAMSGTNSYNKFFNDSIVSCMTGISLVGSNDSSYYDDSNSIGVDGGNVIMNMIGSSSNTKGISVNYQDNVKIANNIVNSGAVASGNIIGIHTMNGLNSNVDIYNNTVTIRPVSGAPYAISNEMGKNGVNNTVNIHHNTIKDCYLAGGSSAFILLANEAAAINVNIHHNILENDSSGSTGSLYGINNGFSAQGNPVCTSNVYANTIRNVKRVSPTGTALSGGIYNAPLIAGCVSNLYDNNISGLSSYGGSLGTQALNGILFSGSSTINIFRNTIHSITSPAASGRASGITFFSSASAGLNAHIYNNYIYNITAPNSNSADAAIGLLLNPASNADRCFAGVYYNTIYLDDSASQPSSTYGSSGIYASSNLPLELRNNIVVNNSYPGAAGGIVAAYKRSSTVLAAYSDSSDNNIFYAGATPGGRRYIYFDGTDSALTVGAFRSKMITRDQESLGSLPQFVNSSTMPYDLHIDPSVATPVEAAGRPVTLPVAVTADFDNDLRDVQTPDIGADEGNFIAGDFEGPSIAFVRLRNTSNTGNRTLEVTISDASGVDSSVSGRPLIYFKKAYVSSYVSAPAVSRSGNTFTFVIDHTLLGGVFASDVIEYYVAAQDLSPLVNVSSSPDGGTGANPPGLFAPEPASYTILTPLSGTYYVGTSPHSPPASYPTLTDAFNDYAGKGLSGPVEFILIDTLYTESTGELFPLTVGENPDASAANTLTVKPATGIHARITGAPALRSSVIKLNASDYVVIDGVNTSSASLTITNQTALPHVDSLNAVIWISSAGAGNGANNNVIRNCNIHGVSPKQTMIGVYVGTAIGTGFGQAVEANSSGNSIDSNYISRSQFGIVFMGSSPTNPATGNKVRGNRMGSRLAGDGFYQQAIVMNRQDNGEVSRNDVQNVFSDEPLNSDDIYGINLLNSRNTAVHSNEVHHLSFTGNTFTLVMGISSTALAYKTAGNPSNNLIYNNVIHNLTSTSTNFTFNTSGINLSDGYGDKVYYNTVSLSGQLSSGNGPSAAFSNGYSALFGNSPTYGNNIDVRNNIFSVTGTTGTSGTKKLYAHYSKAPNTSGSILNNNILYVNVQAPAVGFTGNLNGSDFSTLTDWRAGTGAEAASLASDPQLNSVSVLVPQNGSPSVGAAVPVGITTDFAGNTRSVTAPTIGAYENTGDFRGPDIVFTPLKNTTLTSNLATGNFAGISDASGVNTTTGTAPRLYYKKTGDQNTYTGNTFFDNGWKYVEASGTTSPFAFTIDYSLLQGGMVNIGDTIQYFIVAQDNQSTPNVGSSAALFNEALSVSLDASHFPVSGFNEYRIIPGAQGYVYVGTGQAYPNLTDSGGLFAALRDQLILTGDLTVLITSDLSENGTNDLTTWAEEGTGGYKLYIRPDQPVLRTVSGNVSNALIRISGTRRVIFDGIDTVAGNGRYLHFENLHTSNPVFSLINDARFDTLRNLVITGANTSSLSGLVFIGSSASGGNNFNEISSNILSHSGSARYNTGIYAGGGSLSPNNSNKISGNLIRNFSGSGIYVSSNNGDSWTISSNHICDSFGSPATTAQIGIEFLAQSVNNSINDNYIGGQTWFAGDSSWRGSGNNAFVGITGSFGTAGPNTLSGNTVKNIYRMNPGTSASFAGIRISRGTVNAAGNMIGDSLDASKSIYTSGAAVTTGIDITSSVAGSGVVLSNNYISNLVSSGITSGNRLRGISYSNTSTTNTVPVTIAGNRINGLYSYSNATGFGAGEQAVTGIFVNPNSSSSNSAPVIIRNNTVWDLYAASVSDTASISSGIFLNNVNGTVNANLIYNIRNYSSRNAGGDPAAAAGIIFRATDQVTLSNNMISMGYDTIDNISYIGIWNPVTGGGAKLYHNSVVVRGYNYTTIPSFAFYRGNYNLSDPVNSPLNGNNNIFFNTRTATESYAIGNNSAASGNGFGAVSWNNNVYYNIDANKTGIWNNVAGDLQAFRNSSQKDSASVYHYVNFMQFSTGDLHLTGVSVGDVTLAGVYIPSVTSDFDGESRNVVPYIGADEGVIPVPVKLLAFSAGRNNEDVVLTWATASERNAAYFVPEASADGRHFVRLGEVRAKGNTSSGSSYTFRHEHALRHMNAGPVIYYRLTSVDLDGTRETSNIVMVNFDKEPAMLDGAVAYPNPFSDRVSLAIPAVEDQQASWSIIDLQGRNIRQGTFTLSQGSNTVSIDELGTLEQGVYFVRIGTSRETKVIRMIKQ